jgi:hypothetical protein
MKKSAFFLLGAALTVAVGASAMAGSVNITPAHSLVSRVVADSTELAQYAGTYSFPAGSPVSTITITLEKGELYGEVDGYGRNKILKQTEDHIFKSTSSYGTMYIFQREADKTISGVLLQLMGQELVAKKDKK